MTDSLKMKNFFCACIVIAGTVASSCSDSSSSKSAKEKLEPEPAPKPFSLDSRYAAGKNIKTVFEFLQRESTDLQVKWPGQETIKSAQGFATWFTKRTSVDDAGIWFLGNDPMVDALQKTHHLLWGCIQTKIIKVCIFSFRNN